MTHKYYEDDSEERKKYFDRRLEQYATLKELSSIKDFSSFVEILENAFNRDASLRNYFNNMSEQAKIEFFKRAFIQDLQKKNLIKEGQEDMFKRPIDTKLLITKKEKADETERLLDKQKKQFENIDVSRIRYSPKTNIFYIKWNQEEKNYLKKLKSKSRQERIKKFKQKYSYRSENAIDSQYYKISGKKI